MGGAAPVSRRAYAEADLLRDAGAPAPPAGAPGTIRSDMRHAASAAESGRRRRKRHIFCFLTLLSRPHLQPVSSHPQHYMAPEVIALASAANKSIAMRKQAAAEAQQQEARSLPPLFQSPGNKRLFGGFFQFGTPAGGLEGSADPVYGPPADMWAFGVVLFRMLSGCASPPPPERTSATSFLGMLQSHKAQQSLLTPPHRLFTQRCLMSAAEHARVRFRPTFFS